MKKIKLNLKTNIDLNTLIDTRLLVQANSGGGKSWLIRRILEQSHGKVQQIVIDLEGEFSTLREKYNYVLAGKDGDIPAEPRSAALLARKLLELNVSAIIDLYELDHYQRKHFVKLFLDALVNAPKKLWHPCLVIVDEAHVFCPEKGSSEAASSVIDLCTRGRKRGFCAILATQRLSKLHKDAAAECNNKLIGRTGLDIDRKRASEELGFTSKEQNLSLRSLAAGEFYAFGPAISTDVIKVKVGDVKTSHPRAGSRILTSAPTPPTNKIKSVLNKMVDLPKEAEEEAKTINELKIQLRNSKRALTVAKKITGNTDPKIVENAVIRAEARKDKEFSVEKNTFIRKINGLRKVIEKINLIVSKEIGNKVEMVLPPIKVIPAYRKPVEPKAIPVKVPEFPYVENEKPITGGALRMLEVLTSRYPMTFTKSQLATLSKLSPRSGTYSTYVSILRTRGFIEIDRGIISITDEGLAQMEGKTINKIDSEGVVEMWKRSLRGGARRMFNVLIDIYPDTISKEELAEMAGLVHTSGTFGTYLSMLRSNGLIDVQNSTVTASENLFVDNL